MPSIDNQDQEFVEGFFDFPVPAEQRYLTDAQFRKEVAEQIAQRQPTVYHKFEGIVKDENK